MGRPTGCCGSTHARLRNRLPGTGSAFFVLSLREFYFSFTQHRTVPLGGDHGRASRPWIRQHWKAVAFSFSSLLIVSSACIAIETGEDEPLALALILFLAGTGPFLCWSEKIQALLSIVAIASFAVVSQILPSGVDWYQWFGVLIGAAVGLFSTALARRQRHAQRRAEEELLESREMLIEHERMRIAGQLAAGIAHDLNNTLNVIRLRFALIDQDEQLMAKHRVRLEAIERAIEDAAQQSH